MLCITVDDEDEEGEWTTVFPKDGPAALLASLFHRADILFFLRNESGMLIIRCIREGTTKLPRVLQTLI